MTHTADQPMSPLDAIPDPESIRSRLSALFYEARLLRRLLRLAEARSEQRPTELGSSEDRAHA